MMMKKKRSRGHGNGGKPGACLLIMGVESLTGLPLKQCGALEELLRSWLTKNGMK